MRAGYLQVRGGHADCPRALPRAAAGRAAVCGRSAQRPSVPSWAYMQLGSSRTTRAAARSGSTRTPQKEHVYQQKNKLP